MRTPIYIAEKKKNKYAYQALVNLQKAITMANAYTERKYGIQSEKQLKSALKPRLSAEPLSNKKHVRLALNETPTYEHDSLDTDGVLRKSQELESKRRKIEEMEEFKKIRENIHSSDSSIGSFSKRAIDAREKHYEQQEYLKEILELEKEELEDAESQLQMSQIKDMKDEEIEHNHNLEKIKRWSVIDQKRLNRKDKRKSVLSQNNEKLKLSNQLANEYVSKSEFSESITQEIQNVDLSDLTEDDIREK